jgi:hypothetical protein
VLIDVPGMYATIVAPIRTSKIQIQRTPVHPIYVKQPLAALTFVLFQIQDLFYDMTHASSPLKSQKAALYKTRAAFKNHR